MPCPHCRVSATDPHPGPAPKLRQIPLWPSRWHNADEEPPRLVEIGTLGDSGKADIIHLIAADGREFYLDDADRSVTHTLWHALGGRQDGWRRITDPDQLASYRPVNQQWPPVPQT